jgi:hypothetical protein
MHRLLALVAVLVSAAAFAGGASAALRVGVADNLALATEHTPWFFDSLSELGMTENRIAVGFDATDPTTIQERAALDLYVPLATLRGVRVVFSVAPTKAKGISETPRGAALFANYVELLARTYPSVDDFIIGNEPNQPRFWQPQFDRSGRNVSAPSSYTMLAAAYDALKAVDPSINVIGLGLSPRGGDEPNAPGNVSTSPVRFLHALGNAYRASGRNRPIMDELAFHPYPDHDTDPLLKGYNWPNAGVPNLGRIKQAFWDAFHGTAQPVFPEGTRGNGVKLRLDELGWQVAVHPSAAAAYFGEENIRPTDEQTQSRIYAEAIHYLACDPSVGSVLFFLLRDEPRLNGWQAGLVRADGQRRPSYDAVRSAVARTSGRCQGRMRSWRHSTRVEGARVRWPRQRTLPARMLTLASVLNAEEDARAEVGLYTAGGKRLLRRVATVDAYRSKIVRLSKRLRPGRYVLRVQFRAEVNAARTSSFSAPVVITGRR